MPVFKVIRWESCSQTAFIEADSEEAAEEAADYIDNEGWTENQDIEYVYEAEPAKPSEYQSKHVHKS